MRRLCVYLGLSIAAAGCRDASPPTIASPQLTDAMDAKVDAPASPFPPGDRAWMLADYARAD
jgi:hypothetical protein